MHEVQLAPTQFPKVVLVTGGCGFIGSTFLNLMVPRYPGVKFVNFDALTYAGNPLNLKAIDHLPNYSFEHADLRNEEQTREVIARHQPDWVFHFAAESHVDRSIEGPSAFIQTNIVGTYNLLDACRQTWKPTDEKVFHHVSTDEVYGSLGPDGKFLETTPYDPSSPYSASKAASDHLVRAYHRTYGLPVKMTNCSNNYGPFHFPEKLIPLMTLNCLSGKPLPVYGDGSNVRDWLYVTDHCEAIWAVAERGRYGETYNIGGDSERTNLQVVNGICEAVAAETGRPLSDFTGLITYVKDRPGHDWRYAIDASKVKSELGWAPSVTFEEGLRKTVRWYIDNTDWTESVQSGDYLKWIEQNYASR